MSAHYVFFSAVEMDAQGGFHPPQPIILYPSDLLAHRIDPISFIQIQGKHENHVNSQEALSSKLPSCFSAQREVLPSSLAFFFLFLSPQAFSNSRFQESMLGLLSHDSAEAEAWTGVSRGFL